VTGLIKIAVGLVAVVAPALVFFRQADRKVFLPGHTSAGHHQIEKKCEACHTPMGGVLQKACVDCHGDGLSAAEDSHTTGKFEDPRNALQLGRIDATHCVECHREHRPEDTDRLSVSAKPGFCVECHRDVARERPNHKELAFTTCTNVGCHNFHDNRAVYTDFLIKHQSEPDLLARPVLVGLRGSAAGAIAPAPAGSAAVPAPTTGPSGAPPTTAGDAVSAAAAVVAAVVGPTPDPTPAQVPAPPAADAPSEIEDRGAQDAAGRRDATSTWERSAHAKAGVNCSACHRAGGQPNMAWTWRPDPTVACARCHDDERRTFFGGKHGMRLAVGLPAMVPADALLPMKAAVKNAHEKGLTCARCHDAHGPDLRLAAVETCESCHNDTHTRNYRLSAHYARWEAETSGTGAPGTGVSCATCHLPRTIDRLGDTPRVWVDHNQNANLRPVDKMARSVCMSCHGLAFSIASLADRGVIEGNFTAKPHAIRTGFDLLTRKAP